MTGAETGSDPTLLKHSVGTVIASWFFREYRSYSRTETALWALTQKFWCTQDTLISSLILFTAFSRSFLPCVAHLSMWRFASRTRVANFCSCRAELTGFNDKLNEGAVSGVAVVNPRQAGQWLCEVCFLIFRDNFERYFTVKLLWIHCTSRLFLKPSFSSFGELLIVTGQLADFAKIQLLYRRMQLTSMSNKTLYDCFYTVAFSISYLHEDRKCNRWNFSKWPQIVGLYITYTWPYTSVRQAVNCTECHFFSGNGRWVLANISKRINFRTTSVPWNGNINFQINERRRGGGGGGGGSERISTVLALSLPLRAIQSSAFDNFQENTHIGSLGAEWLITLFGVPSREVCSHGRSKAISGFEQWQASHESSYLGICGYPLWIQKSANFLVVSTLLRLSLLLPSVASVSLSLIGSECGMAQLLSLTAWFVAVK